MYSYRRAPSKEFLKLLMPDRSLNWLVALNAVKVCGHQHDVHFRAGDEVHVYRGGTRILRIQRMDEDIIGVSAHPTYREQSCGKALFGLWTPEDPALREATEAYIWNVKVGTRWTEGEGAIQMKWSRVVSPWTPFDREAVLRCEPTDSREQTRNPIGVESALESIEGEAKRKGWKLPAKSEGTGEVDQLAIDPEGQLVILELKDGSNRDDKIYYAPFQLLQYLWEWHYALCQVRDDLRRMIESRKRLCMIPKDTPDTFGGIRGVVTFGCQLPQSETKRRFSRVLEIVNQPKFLPPAVPPIQVWYWSVVGPTQLA